MTEVVDSSAPSPSSEFGLKNDWTSVQKTLEEIIPVYDKTNRYISLGTDLRLRKRGLELLAQEVGKDKFSVLDLGCGTGKMMQLFIELNPSQSDQLLLVDPIPEMVKIAVSRTRKDGVRGVYENLSIREGSFDSAMAGFSLRDARDMSKALAEIRSLLIPGGKFLIVDLAKPDSKVRSSLIGIYWRTLAPAIAFLSSGRLGLKFGALATTYRRLPRISKFFELANESGFQVARKEFSMMDGAAVIVLRKDSDR